MIMETAYLYAPAHVHKEHALTARRVGRSPNDVQSRLRLKTPRLIGLNSVALCKDRLFCRLPSQADQRSACLMTHLRVQMTADGRIASDLSEI